MNPIHRRRRRWRCALVVVVVAIVVAYRRAFWSFALCVFYLILFSFLFVVAFMSCICGTVWSNFELCVVSLSLLPSSWSSTYFSFLYISTTAEYTFSKVSAQSTFSAKRTKPKNDIIFQFCHLIWFSFCFEFVYCVSLSLCVCAFVWACENVPVMPVNWKLKKSILVP